MTIHSPRFVPGIAFPAYTYIPRRAPHPTSNPAGHSFGSHGSQPHWSVDQWHRCEEYLYGIDLFNHGYYWEAHEAWEELWHSAGRTGAVADVLKGMIKLAAAGVKILEGSAVGRRRHALRAAELFRQAESALSTNGTTAVELMGLPLGLLAALATEAAEISIPTADSSTGPQRVFPFLLLPTLPEKRIS